HSSPLPPSLPLLSPCHPPPPPPPLFPYTTLFRSPYLIAPFYRFFNPVSTLMLWRWATGARVERTWTPIDRIAPALPHAVIVAERSEEHTSELQSLTNLVCRLLLEKKKNKTTPHRP